MQLDPQNPCYLPCKINVIAWHLIYGPVMKPDGQTIPFYLTILKRFLTLFMDPYLDLMDKQCHSTNNIKQIPF